MTTRRFARGLVTLAAIAALAAIPVALGACKSSEASQDTGGKAAAGEKSTGACCAKCGTGCGCGGSAACCKTS